MKNGCLGTPLYVSKIQQTWCVRYQKNTNIQLASQRSKVCCLLWCSGFSQWWLLLLQSMGSRAHGLQQLQHTGSAVAAPRLYITGSCFGPWAYVIFPGQELNTCPLYWLADSYPLHYQGSCTKGSFIKNYLVLGSSLAACWLGFGSFTVEARVLPLVREPSCVAQYSQNTKKKKNPKNPTRFSTNSKGREKERIPKSFEFGLVILKV